MSAGGTRYFMILIDSATSFRHVKFLKEKVAKTMLKVFKKYITETKQLTRQRLLSVRVDRGCEWNNWLWQEYKDEKGFVLEFTIAYAHQQNSTTKYSMQTILDTTYSMLMDLGLPT